MGYFENNRVVTLDDLRNSGMYNEALITSLNSGDFKVLAELKTEERTNRDFMEPILYALKNEYDTYIVYKYYGASLQDDIKLAKEIVIREPELIRDTPMSSNKQFIQDTVLINPEVVNYMFQSLKADTEFVMELYGLQNTEVVERLTKDTDVLSALLKNDDLRNSKTFMTTAIEKNVNTFKFASEELKNDYSFLKEQSNKTEKVIDYVVHNTNEFGLEGIKGTRDTTREFTMEECMEAIDEMFVNSKDERYQKVKNKIAEVGLEDVHAVKWITAMVAQGENVAPALVKKVLDYSVLSMEKTQRDLTENGEMKVSIDNIHELITPQILSKLQEKTKAQGLELSPNLEKKLEEYNNFYQDFRNKLKEKKMQSMQEKTEEDVTVTPADVEEVTQNTSIANINVETSVVKESLSEEKHIEKEVEAK